MVSGCDEQEAGVVNGRGWNLWVWLVGVVVRRYIDFLILLIPTPLVSGISGISRARFSITHFKHKNSSKTVAMATDHTSP